MNDRVERGTSFCGHCGLLLEGRPHAVCDERLALEPPRFCASCRRRTKVQVLPVGWSSECVEHGRVQG